ncbi:MAG: hypothetical protein AAAB35_29745 [Phyllobacterium sp.]|uniref:hypothetical protein n=1 Tax=Phyllobacterium sp. TaxID=1871046 RepID=UPI0030EFBC90
MLLGHDKASLRAGRRIHRPKSYKSDEFWFNNGFPIQVVLLLVWLAIIFHGLDWS